MSEAIARAARRLGIQALRPEQVLAIEHALAGRDVLVVLPTGFGKSACYQVPSLVLERSVLLISPLLALLEDQERKLRARDIPAVRIDGTVRGPARRDAYARILQGGPLLVMTTPESLASPWLAEALRYTGVSIAAVDEAHCISEWGFDFRPSYLELGERIRRLGIRSTMALTATATENVRADIVRYLGMREPAVVAASPDRKNLAFEVFEADDAERVTLLLRLVERLRRPGIVYAATTRQVDTLYVALRRIGVPAHRYHGRMSDGARTREQALFMKRGRRTVMVATSAFGLGIDNPHIRYVIHAQAPASLDQYVQEAGRAGRDGRRARCILLFSASDRAIHEALLEKSRIRPERLGRLGEALAAWAAEGRTPTLEALAVSADLGLRTTKALLAIAEEANLVHHRNGEIVVAGDPACIEADIRSLARKLETLRIQDARRLDSVEAYARTWACRARQLRRYFGEPEGERCRICDVCRGAPARPPELFVPYRRPRAQLRHARRR